MKEIISILIGLISGILIAVTSNMNGDGHKHIPVLIVLFIIVNIAMIYNLAMSYRENHITIGRTIYKSDSEKVFKFAQAVTWFMITFRATNKTH